MFTLTDTARFFLVRNAAGRTSVAFRLRVSGLNGACWAFLAERGAQYVVNWRPSGERAGLTRHCSETQPSPNKPLYYK